MENLIPKIKGLMAHHKKNCINILRSALKIFKKEPLKIYTDASCISQTGSGAIAFVVTRKEVILHQHSQSFEGTHKSSLKLELLAISAAVKYAEKHYKKVPKEIYTDCQPAIDKIAKLKELKPCSLNKKTMFVKVPGVDYIKIQGHQRLSNGFGAQMNRIADKLAHTAAKKHSKKILKKKEETK